MYDSHLLNLGENPEPYILLDLSLFSQILILSYRARDAREPP
jgi:hypothetical protein